MFPFTHDEYRLFSLSSGTVTNDSDYINCDDAECVYLACFQKQCCVGKKPLNIDSSMLFHHLVVLVERTPDISIYFQYELVPILTALF